MIKHRIKLHTQRTTVPAQDFIMAECETLQVGIQRFKLKKSIAAIIHLELLEEDGKRESRRGKTRGWIKRRKEKGYFNNMIVDEMMMEDTPGYCEMIWMTRDDFLEILQLTESDITPRQATKIDQKICFFIVPFPFPSFALLSFITRRFFSIYVPIFCNIHQSFFFVCHF